MRLIDPVFDKPLPPPPAPLPAGHVEVSVLTDTDIPARVTLAADHDLLPFLLARKSTRVRRVAPGVNLPAPDPTETAS